MSRSGQPWTDAEDQLLLDLLALGKDVYGVANTLQRTFMAVNTRMCLLRQEYVEEPEQLLLSDQILTQLARHYRKGAAEIADFLRHDTEAVAERLRIIDERRR
jgi:hypothetical protein